MPIETYKAWQCRFRHTHESESPTEWTVDDLYQVWDPLNSTYTSPACWEVEMNAPPERTGSYVHLYWQMRQCAWIFFSVTSCLRVCVYVDRYTWCICTYIHLYLPWYTWYIYIYIYMHTRTHMYISYTYIYIYIYIYIHACAAIKTCATLCLVDTETCTLCSRVRMMLAEGSSCGVVFLSMYTRSMSLSRSYSAYIAASAAESQAAVSCTVWAVVPGDSDYRELGVLSRLSCMRCALPYSKLFGFLSRHHASMVAGVMSGV